MSKALIVIDVQQGLFERDNPILHAEQVLNNINQLVNQAHEKNVPVVYVQHSNENTLVYGSREWELHLQIQPLETETLIHKVHGNAFIDTSLGEELKAKGITQLVITGLVTHGCVKATTLGALELGYDVILVSDGHSNFSKDAAKIIKKWNKTLAEKGAVLREAAEVKF